MSTYYGLKPIVGEGLISFIHGLNINGYNNEITLEDTFGNVEFEISNSEEIRNRQKTTFRTNGTDQDLTSLSGSVYNPDSGSFTFSMWFKPIEIKNNSGIGYIFEKGNQFNLILTSTSNLVFEFISNDYGGTMWGVAVTGSHGFLSIGTSNQHHALIEFDTDTLEPIKSKWNYTQNATMNCTSMGQISIDSSSFWVGSRTYARLVEFDHYDDEWYRQFSKSYINFTYDTTADNIADDGAQMCGIDFDNDYVYYTNNTTFSGVKGWICKMTRDGTYITGSGIGANDLFGICIDRSPSTGSNGYFVYNHAFGVFDKDTMEITQITGTYSTTPKNYTFNEPYGICCDRDYIYVGIYGSNHGRVVKYRKSDLSYVNETGSYSNWDIDKYAMRPNDLAVDENYIYVTSYYPATTWKNKVTKLDKNTFEYLGERKFALTAQNTSETYHYACKCVYATASHFFMADRANKMDFWRLDENGNYFYKGQHYRISTTYYGDAYNMVLDQGIINTEPTGFVWFADNDRDAVTKFQINSDYTTNFVTQSYAGANSTAINGWNTPRRLAADFENRWLYVIDYSNDRLKKLDLDTLVTLVQTGSGASGDYQMANAWGIAVSESYVFLHDAGSNRFKKFNTDLEYIETLSTVPPSVGYNLLYDKPTNTFYYFNSSRFIVRYDHNFDEMYRSNNYPSFEQFGGTYNNWTYQTWVDDRFIYHANLYKLSMIDKFHLTHQNHFGAYQHTLRTKPIQTGSWHNVAVTFDENNHVWSFYLDGEFQVSRSVVDIAYNFWNRQPLRLGKWDWFTYGGNFMETEYGAIMAYNRTLTSSEIKQNYDALKWEYSK